MLNLTKNSQEKFFIYEIKENHEKIIFKISLV